MAVCLLCTRAKESLPWPIKDRFVEYGSASTTVQPHVWYGTDLDSNPLSQHGNPPGGRVQRAPGADTCSRGDPWSGSAQEMRMYRVTKCWGSINKAPFMAKISLRAPNVSRGGCWCDGSGYGSSLYLIQLEYIVWGKVYNLCRGYNLSGQPCLRLKASLW